MGSIFIAIIGLFVPKIINSYVLISGVTISISAIVYALTLIIMKDEFFMGYMRPLMDRVRRNN